MKMVMVSMKGECFVPNQKLDHFQEKKIHSQAGTCVHSTGFTHVCESFEYNMRDEI